LTETTDPIIKRDEIQYIIFNKHFVLPKQCYGHDPRPAISPGAAAIMKYGFSAGYSGAGRGGASQI
jgi:hypothetical protein